MRFMNGLQLGRFGSDPKKTLAIHLVFHGFSDGLGDDPTTGATGAERMTSLRNTIITSMSLGCKQGPL